MKAPNHAPFSFSVFPTSWHFNRRERGGCAEERPYCSLLLFFSFTLLLFFPKTAESQILQHPKGEFFTEDPFFNKQFIKQNDIRWVRARLSTKQEMDRIRSEGLGYFYRFKKNGKMDQQLEVYIHSDTIRDTTFINYHYDKQGRLVTKRRNDLHGFYSYQYEYDSLDRVTKETYTRDENLDSSRHEFRLGKQIVINSESYNYERIDELTVRRKVLNSNGLVYKEQTMYYDSLGYLKRQTTLFVVNRRRSEMRYKYDAKGRVIERIEDNDLADTNQRRKTYKYDKVGNLLGMEVYENGNHKLHKEYLYKDNMLLNAELTKDVETMLITILKFSYGFYGEEGEERTKDERTKERKKDER